MKTPQSEGCIPTPDLSPNNYWVAMFIRSSEYLPVYILHSVNSRL